MYSEDVKIRFLKSDAVAPTEARKDIIIGRYKQLFENFEDLERENGCDLAELPWMEIKDAIEQMDYISYSSMRNLLWLMRNYNQWYGDTLQKQTTEIPDASDVDLTDSFRRNLILSPEELLRISSVHSAQDGCIDEPVGILAWMGKSLREMLALRDADIASDGDDVFVRDVIVEPRELGTPLLYYKETSRFHPNHTLVVKMPGEMFLRRTGKTTNAHLYQPLTEKTVKNILYNHKNDFAKPFNIATLNSSGMFYRLLQADKHGEIITARWLQENMDIGKHASTLRLDYECYCKAIGEY